VKATAICDGRGNAGTGARAAVLYIGDGLQGDRHKRAEKLPATTNIVAEHLATQLAMELAKEHGVTELVIYNDSRSPVNHVNGSYKVKQEHLIPIVEKTWEMRAEFSSFEICWTSRENTKEADALCRSVDARAPRTAALDEISDSGTTSLTACGRPVSSRQTEQRRRQ
jgi:probable phosphoglycerate mutase